MRKTIGYRAGKSKSSEHLLRIGIFVVTLLIVFLIWKSKRLLYQFENFGYIGLFLINALSSATVFLPLPSVITVFVGGSVWNPFFVGIISGLGNGVGELMGFFLGFGGRGIINNLDGRQKSWLKRIERWFRKSGFITIFITSALPDPFFDLVGILAGSLNYPVWKFFVATAAGRIFRNLIIAWSGAKIIP